jgi:deoxyinosine 3'endonuclease (endonuclease V)
MILALDSYYVGDVCNTSLVVFETNPYNTIYYTDTIYTTVTCEYIPGEFYKRELTGIQEILNKLMTERPDIWSNVDAVIVDSYVKLKAGDTEWGGLGQHLHDWLASIGQHRAVWGVAKSKFGDCDKISELVYRGKSKTPLYVQSTGISNKVTANVIRSLKGEYRIPDILKHVDQLSRIFK